MSVLSRLTDSLLVRLLFRSILLLLHVDKMHYFFHTNFKLFALLSVQSLYSVFFQGICMHTLVTLALWRISLIWAGNFSLALDFPFKYWPLRSSTLCWVGLSILCCTTWYNISTYGCSMTMMMVMGNLLEEILASSVILLQIHVVMVHPGTHLTCEKSWVPVQNQWVPVKKKKTSPKLKILWPLCKQTVNLKTHSKTLYY